MAEKSPYPVRGVHCRVADGLTTYSVYSPDPQIIIAWLTDFISQHTSFSVDLDHDFSQESHSALISGANDPD